jgi:hypothetical protein
MYNKGDNKKMVVIIRDVKNDLTQMHEVKDNSEALHLIKAFKKNHAWLTMNDYEMIVNDDCILLYII